MTLWREDVCCTCRVCAIMQGIVFGCHGSSSHRPWPRTLALLSEGVPDTSLAVHSMWQTACKLELWQEAFRTVEDIHGLVSLNKQIVKPQMKAMYYALLTQIFAFSEDSMMNCAYAWLKVFNLARKYNTKLKPTDVQMMATAVMLTALSILPYQRSFLGSFTELRSDHEKERQRRLSSILSFATVS